MKKSLLLLVVLMCLSCSKVQKKDVYLLIGQSNMAGRGNFENPQDSLQIENVFLLNDSTKFEPAKNPLNRYSTIRKTEDPNLQKIGIGYSFSKEMATFLKDSVYLIVNAKGGTPIEDFLKGNEKGYYESILNRTINALNEHPELNLRAILWHQGESNANNAEDYLEKLNKMVTDFRTDLGKPKLPLIAGQLGDWNNNYNDIRKQIKMIPTHIENAFLVNSEGLTNKDEHHFNTESYKELGRRYAELCKEAIYQAKK